MSAIAQAQRNKDADLRRRSPTGHDDARPNMPPAHQIHHPSPWSVPIEDCPSKPLSQLNAIYHRAQSHQAPSNTPAVPLKSP